MTPQSPRVPPTPVWLPVIKCHILLPSKQWQNTPKSTLKFFRKCQAFHLAHHITLSMDLSSKAYPWLIGWRSQYIHGMGPPRLQAVNFPKEMIKSMNGRMSIGGHFCVFIERHSQRCSEVTPRTWSTRSCGECQRSAPCQGSNLGATHKVSPLNALSLTLSLLPSILPSLLSGPQGGLVK